MACKGKGVLVAPKWILSPFWSSIVDNDGCFKSFVKDYVEYKNPSRFFVRGTQRNSIFHEEKVSFSVVVLRRMFLFQWLILISSAYDGSMILIL